MSDTDNTAPPLNDGVSAAAEAALAQLSKDPAFQSVLQKHLNSSMNSKRAYYDNLPNIVKSRVRALKNIQVDILKLEAQFYEEIQRLEVKYQNLYQPYFDKREQIISGAYEPTPDESNWPDSEDEPDDDDDKQKDDETAEVPNDDNDKSNGATKTDSNDDKGVSSFWLNSMKNIDLFSDYIEEHDEAILSHLYDIKLKYNDAKGMDFTLEFHFSDNDYFTNKVLTKKYTMTCEVSKDDPFSFEGATITEVKGCKIDWKKGKNVTVKTIKKKQKHKGKGQSRVVTKTVPNDSFFNFFSPPDPNTFENKEEDEVDDLTIQLESDINRAEFIRDRLIPKAVLYFTGDIIDDDEDDDVDMGEDEDETDDSDGGDDYNPQRDLQNAKPPECNQQ